mgnify:CR=1 FL=1
MILMNDNLVFKVLNSLLLKRIYENRCSNMLLHIEKSLIEQSYKYSKINKLYKLINDVKSIKYISLNLHKLSFTWIELRWKNLVLECGYINIDNTLKFINKNYYDEINIINGSSNQLITIDFYNNYIKSLITPIHIQILKKTSTDNIIKIYEIKPSLTTTHGKLYGLCIEYIYNDISYLIFGVIEKDSFRFIRDKIDYSIIYDKLFEKCKNEDNFGCPCPSKTPCSCEDEYKNLIKKEYKKHLTCFSLRDILIYEPSQLVNKIKQQKEKLNHYREAENDILYTEYMFLPYEYRVGMINLMLEYNLIDSVKYIISKTPLNYSYLDIKLYYKIKSITLPLVDNNYIKSSFLNNSKNSDEDNFKNKIDNLNTTDKNKRRAYDKLKILEMSNDGAPKAYKYLDGFMKIPFEKIRIEKQLTEKSHKKQIEYINTVNDILNQSVHGHKLVKTEIKRLIAQWITGGQSGLILGIEGPPGVGKTSIIKNGLSQCLIDENKNPRPVGFIPLGGSSNASSLVGHGYTYQGSSWGRIVDILMDSSIMNPILMFDELDKVSKTECGKEVISILTHLTDTTQNKEFYDKYFEGVALDVSKSLMIFTFNNRNDIDPILLDRMTIIETKPLTLNDKLIITDKHLLPSIYKSLNLENISISNKIITEIIHTYTREAGVRQLKKIMESLCQELNLRKILTSSTGSNLKITNSFIREVLSHRDKTRDIIKPMENSLIGQINGMYANVLGLGGILPIQVSRHTKDNEMVLTGMQGDVMKESMNCAKTMAYELYYKNNDDKNNDKNNNDKNNGIHIHVPSASQPKDGPSAGGAICLAIYSHLTNKKIKTDISITGEIDLRGNIGAIGGLYAKLHGAKRATIKTALIPYDNLEQLERLRKDKLSPEDKNFKVILIKHINEALEFIIE